MTSRTSSLLPDFTFSLQNFIKSPTSKFRVVQTIPAPRPSSKPPKTLYILDSSFNPPSRAHLSIATSALTSPVAKYEGETSVRLLLLFSTHNADKKSAPAGFEDRVAMMVAFAEDIRDALRSSGQQEKNDLDEVAIDVGLTKEPYYTDKTTAIEGEASSLDNGRYPKGIRHVHLVGYDTFVRICNPKYYPSAHPPLSVLAPFFASGHALRVTLRPSDSEDSSSKEFGSVAEQKRYIEGLQKGELLREEGWKREWGEKLEVIEGDEGVGVSSSRVRRAVKAGDWEEVGVLVTSRVKDWIQERGLYRE